MNPCIEPMYNREYLYQYFTGYIQFGKMYKSKAENITTDLQFEGVQLMNFFPQTLFVINTKKSKRGRFILRDFTNINCHEFEMNRKLNHG